MGGAQERSVHCERLRQHRRRALGVRRQRANGTLTVTGVVDADKLQNTFLGQVRDLNKISAQLPITGQVHQVPEGVVLAFFVPEAARNQKPASASGS